jgi:hypothetical protein
MNAKTILDNFLPYQQKKRRNNRKRLRAIASAKKEAA